MCVIVVNSMSMPAILEARRDPAVRRVRDWAEACFRDIAG